jgi:hypothetical protein
MNRTAGSKIVIKRSFGSCTVAYPLPVFLDRTYDLYKNLMQWLLHGMAYALTIPEPRYIGSSLAPDIQEPDGKKEFPVSIPSVDQMNRADAFGITSGEDKE